MKYLVYIIIFLVAVPVIPGWSQGIGNGEVEGSDWNRTRAILDCAPRLVDRRDLVEDNFDHRYVTDNPRDIEIGYFSVEPITYLEEGRRFCEALLPASGVSHTYFRGCYVTSYYLPGDGVYNVTITSNALIFNNELRIINAQNTIAEIEATHRMEIEVDTTLNPSSPEDITFRSNRAYGWELEIDQSGAWHGELLRGDLVLYDSELPAGLSKLVIMKRIKGPGLVRIRESVIFRVNSVSSYKYDPIFQAACLFSLEPLSVTTRLLPCEQ
jgi:hypothetical protein